MAVHGVRHGVGAQTCSNSGDSNTGNQHVVDGLNILVWIGTAAATGLDRIEPSVSQLLDEHESGGQGISRPGPLYMTISVAQREQPSYSGGFRVPFLALC